jgi:hypothetical protein
MITFSRVAGIWERGDAFMAALSLKRTMLLDKRHFLLVEIGKVIHRHVRAPIKGGGNGLFFANRLCCLWHNAATRIAIKIIKRRKIWRPVVHLNLFARRGRRSRRASDSAIATA